MTPTSSLTWRKEGTTDWRKSKRATRQRVRSRAAGSESSPKTVSVTMWVCLEFTVICNWTFLGLVLLNMVQRQNEAKQQTRPSKSKCLSLQRIWERDLNLALTPFRLMVVMVLATALVRRLVWTIWKYKWKEIKATLKKTGEDRELRTWRMIVVLSQWSVWWVSDG